MTNSVATLDVLASGARLGKGVLTVGDHAKLADLSPRMASDPSPRVGTAEGRRVCEGVLVPATGISPLGGTHCVEADLFIHSGKACVRNFVGCSSTRRSALIEE